MAEERKTGDCNARIEGASPAIIKSVFASRLSPNTFLSLAPPKALPWCGGQHFFEENENFIIRSYRMNKYLVSLQKIARTGCTSA